MEAPLPEDVDENEDDYLALQYALAISQQEYAFVVGSETGSAGESSKVTDKVLDCRLAQMAQTESSVLGNPSQRSRPCRIRERMLSELEMLATIHRSTYAKEKNLVGELGPDDGISFKGQGKISLEVGEALLGKLFYTVGSWTNFELAV
jgi:hypothetical protein